MDSNLESMTVDDLKKEIAEQEKLIKEASVYTNKCRLLIISKLAEAEDIRLGDLLVDGKGQKWLLCEIAARFWDRKNPLSFFGKKIKKNGEPGAVTYEIYRGPIQVLREARGKGDKK